MVALDENGRQPPSAYTEDGGTRIEVDLDFAFSGGIWRNYLPRDWPKCIRVNAWPSLELMNGHVRNLNRYLDCHAAKTIEIHEISGERGGHQGTVDPSAARYVANGWPSPSRFSISWRNRSRDR